MTHNSDVTPITFSNCTIRENRAVQVAAIQLAFTSMRIDSKSVFRENKASIYPGIYLFYSNATIVDAIFENQKSPEASFIRGIYSSVDVANSTFTGAQSTSSAAVTKMSDNSKLSMSNVMITEITSFKGTIAVDLASSLEADNLTMSSMASNSTFSAIQCSESNCTIANSQFSDADYTMILVDESSVLTISNTQFINSTSPIDSGFIAIYQANFTLDNVDFEQGKGLQGGALYVTHDFT